LIPIATRTGYNILLNWEPQVATFIRSESLDSNSYRAHFRDGATSRAPIVWGLVFNALSFLAYALAGIFTQLNWYSKIFAALLLISINFMCGIVLCSMWFLGKLVWKIGHSDVHVSRHSYGVTSTGPVLLRVYLLAAGVWFTISLSAYRSAYSLV